MPRVMRRVAWIMRGTRARVMARTTRTAGTMARATRIISPAGTARIVPRITAGVSAAPTGTIGTIAGRRRRGNWATGVVTRIATTPAGPTRIVSRVAAGITTAPTGTSGTIAGIARGRSRGIRIAAAPARPAGIAAGIMARVIAATEAGATIATAAAIGEDGARKRRRESQR